MKQQFYICKHCGHIVAFLRNNGVPIICCGEEMREITPGITEDQRGWCIRSRRCVY